MTQEIRNSRAFGPSAVWCMPGAWRTLRTATKRPADCCNNDFVCILYITGKLFHYIPINSRTMLRGRCAVIAKAVMSIHGGCAADATCGGSMCSGKLMVCCLQKSSSR